MSSVRQFMTIHVIRPIGQKLGVPDSKLMRFMERRSLLPMQNVLKLMARGLCDLLHGHFQLIWHGA